jgi:hypothetical protein
MLKYPRITNHYDEKFIKLWLQNVPNLLDNEFVGQLKYDGANVSIEFNKNQALKFFTRNNKLGGSADFMGFREILSTPKYAAFLNKIQSWLEHRNCVQKINLFGELYGPRVQNRINYGNERRIKFFDVYFDYKLQSVSGLNEWFKNFDALDFLVEIQLKDVSFKEMLDLAEKISNSTEIEGFVIKPLHKVYLDDKNLPFYVKVKSRKFNDHDTTDTCLINILSCINQNRILDCRSKTIWKNFEEFTQLVVYDVLNECDLLDSNKEPIALPKEWNKIICGKINQVSKNLFNLKTGELIKKNTILN